jgi:galactokinase
MTFTQKIQQAFYQHFAHNPVIVRSPGRINLIGEHTDYNLGFVMPAAIDKAMYVGISPREDEEVHLVSLDYEEQTQFNIRHLQKNNKAWSYYVMGIVEQLLPDYKIGGFNCVIAGEVPLGAGLSSSAALECAVLFGLNEIFSLNIPRIEMAKIAQAAENSFVGVQSGIMDQFASLMSRAGEVMLLDCRSLQHEFFPLKMSGLQLILLDSQVKHSLAATEYNRRRQECEEGVQLLQAVLPEIQSLREVRLEDLQKNAQLLPEIIYRRCRFVVEENARVLAASQDLQAGNMEDFGKKMYDSHYGLRDLYEVSCLELDVLVNLAQKNPGVLGSRMMGGGFGGCTLNLVREEGVGALLESVERYYSIETGQLAKIYAVTLENGTEIMVNSYELT